MKASAPARIPRWTTSTCPSGKRGYSVKADARRVASAMRREGSKVRAYLCDRCPNFHVGHLPQAVRDGEVSAEEFYSHKTGLAPRP